MSKEEKEENERLTDDETIPLKHIGGSKGSIIPAHWLRTIPELKREPFIFIAHVERDKTGRIFLILQKARAEPLTPKQNNHIKGR